MHDTFYCCSKAQKRLVQRCLNHVLELTLKQIIILLKQTSFLVSTQSKCFRSYISLAPPFGSKNEISAFTVIMCFYYAVPPSRAPRAHHQHNEVSALAQSISLRLNTIVYMQFIDEKHTLSTGKRIQVDDVLFIFCIFEIQCRFSNFLMTL